MSLQAAVIFHSCCWVFWKIPWLQGLSHEWALKSYHVKDTPWDWSFSSPNRQLWWIGFRGPPDFSTGCQTAVFHSCWNCENFHFKELRKKVKKLRWTKTLQTCFSCWNSGAFSWRNRSQMGCKSSVDFDNFCPYSCCFYWWVYFQGSLFCHSGIVPTLPTLIIAVQNFNLKISLAWQASLNCFFLNSIHWAFSCSLSDI